MNSASTTDDLTTDDGMVLEVSICIGMLYDN